MELERGKALNEGCEYDPESVRGDCNEGLECKEIQDKQYMCQQPGKVTKASREAVEQAAEAASGGDAKTRAFRRERAGKWHELQAKRHALPPHSLPPHPSLPFLTSPPLSACLSPPHLPRRFAAAQEAQAEAHR